MDSQTKEPFVISTAMRHLRVAVKHYPKAAMFELADEGFTSVFEQLIACMISIRTLEVTTLATARRLFAVARTPAEVAALSVERIDELINPCTFHRAKASQIHAIAEAATAEHHNQLPNDRDAILKFAGVGPKCANLALGVTSGEPLGVPVDIHVHRVVNRWGIVAARTPELTMVQLEAFLPRRYWLEINKLLVPFGKHICRGVRPRCPICPLLSMCNQVGVTEVSNEARPPSSKEE